MQTFGSGPFAIFVEWKVTDSTGKTQKSVYRYKDESTRNNKLKEFKRNSKVKTATATI